MTSCFVSLASDLSKQQQQFTPKQLHLVGSTNVFMILSFVFAPPKPFTSTFSSSRWSAVSPIMKSVAASVVSKKLVMVLHAIPTSVGTLTSAISIVRSVSNTVFFVSSTNKAQ